MTAAAARGRGPFVWRRRVAMRDVDAFDVVWYGNYLGYCDEARAELMRAFGLPPSRFADLGYAVAVVEASCRYHAPARFDDEIDVHVRIADVRGSKLRFDFEVRRGDETLLARISTTLVLLRRNGDLVYLLPEPFAGMVEQIVAAQSAPRPT